MADDDARVPVTAPGADERRFEPVREIARGGMGRVVESVDVHLDRTVAVKSALDGSPEVRARFEREIAITARLEHPSIVPVYDAGITADGSPFYVMRRLTGVPLDRLIREATTLDQRLVLLPNLLAVCDAVAHAHRRGIIHRDLKPHNVLVGELGETVVIDWGLAKTIDAPDDAVAPTSAPATTAVAGVTTAGVVIGTPGYMAPEQVLAEPTDARADVYALGACLYHVLGGRSPFHGASESTVLDNTVGAAAPAPLASIAPGVAPELITIVAKAMAVDREARYLDAGGVSEDLRRFLGGQLVASHRYPVRARLWRWLRRHRAVVSAVAIAAVVVIALAVIGVTRIVDEQARTAAALAREKRRADDLIVAQAKFQLRPNPTLAIATLHQLADDSPHWRTLDPTILDARAHGVAVGYPGHGGPTTVDLAPGPGDDRVVSSGRGIVRVHDLAARTTRDLITDGDAVTRAWWCGDNVIVHHERSIYIVDPRGGARDELAWPTPIRYVVVSREERACTLVLVDADHRVAAARVDTGAPTPTVLVEAGALPSIAVAPSGGRVAVAVAGTLRLFRATPDRGGFTETARSPGSDAGVFDREGRRHATVTGGRAVELDLDQSPPAELRSWTLPASTGPAFLAYAGGRLYLMTRGDLHLLDDGGRVAPWSGHGGPGPLADVLDRVAVLETPRQIAIVSGTARTRIAIPFDAGRIAGKPGGRYLVTAGPSDILAWDVGELASRRTAIASATAIAFRDDGRLIATEAVVGSDRYATLFAYDLDRSSLAIRSRIVAQLEAPVEIDVFGDPIIARYPATATAELVEPRTPIAVTGITRTLVDGTTILVALRSGELHQVDRMTGRSTGIVVARSSPIATFLAHRGTIVVVFDDGTAWRRDVAGGVTTTEIGASVGVALADDGALAIGKGRDVLVWRSAGSPAIAATLGVAIVRVSWIAGDRIAAITEDGVLHVVDPAAGIGHAVAPAAQQVDISAGGRVAVVWIGTPLSGYLAIVDLVSRQSWRLIDEIALVPGGLAVSPDGTIVVAAERDAMHAWRLGIDGGSHRWARRATNALPTSTGEVMVWGR